MMVVAIDPGVHVCGLAAFVEGELVHAELTTGLGGQIHPLLEVVDGVEHALKTLTTGLEMQVETLIVEKPQVYEARLQKGDQRDLIDLAIVVGCILDRARPYATSALLVHPHDWKQNTPKDITAARVEKHLSPEEYARIEWPSANSSRHNVYDAIALGLWRLDR